MKKFASVLDYPHPGLDPMVWEKSGKLKPHTKEFILQSLSNHLKESEFIAPEQWMEGIVLVGSLTTYQYTSKSDTDIHIKVDLEKFIEAEKLNFSKEQAHVYLDNVRKLWNKQKVNLPGTKHPVEYFFETPLVNPEGLGTGVYSLQTDTWDSPPVPVSIDFDIEEMKPFLIDMANVIADEMDGSFGTIKRHIQRIEELQEVMQAWPEDKRKIFLTKIEDKLGLIEEEIEELSKAKEKIVQDRRKDYDKQSPQEVKFKYLQRFGYLWIITSLNDLVDILEGGEVEVADLPKMKEILDTPVEKQAKQDDLTEKLFIDFDKTIAASKGKEVGSPLPGVKEAFDGFKKDGWEIHVYSCRANDEEGLDAIQKFMSEHDLPFDSIFKGKPLGHYYIDDRALKFTTWSEVVPQVKKQASLLISAELNGKLWVDPYGRQFQVNGTHQQWIESNLEKLRKDYQLSNFGNDATGVLIEDGWTRITTDFAIEEAQFGVHVKDLRNLPKCIDELMPEWYSEQLGSIGTPVMFQDEQGQVVTVERPFPAQRTVNRALMSSTKMAKAAGKEGIKYSSVHVNIPSLIAQDIVAWGVRNIPDEDLFIDEERKSGRELESHITIKYGLLTNEPKDVEKFLKGIKPVEIKLGKTKHFEPPELPFDVVTIQVVDSDILPELNSKLSDSLECGEGLIEEYRPHITVAYVKRGTGHKYVGDSFMKDTELTLDEVVFSPAEGEKTTFELGAKKESHLNLNAYEKKIFQDPTPQQAEELLKNSKSAMLRWAIGNDGHLYMWDAYYLDHPMARAKLGVDWKLDNSGYLGERIPVSYNLGKFWEERNLVEAAFMPSIVQAPDNPWQSDSDIEIPVDPDSTNEEQTYNAPQADKPRKTLWDKFMDFFRNKKEAKASPTSEILKLVQETGGATYNFSQGNLSGTGNYAVATYPDRGAILDHMPTEAELDQYIKTNQDILSSSVSLGAWSNDGKVYLDIVTTIPDLDKAVQLGKENNQIAIFDLKNLKEIPTGGTGEIKQSAIAPTPPPTNEYKRTKMRPLGVTEIWYFQSIAPQEIQDEVDALLDAGKTAEAWVIMEKYIGRRHLNPKGAINFCKNCGQTHEMKQTCDNTTWDDSRQDGEPFSPLPTTFQQTTNDENLGQPGVRRFMGRPQGPDHSNNEEILPILLNDEKQTKKKASSDFGGWVSPDGKFYETNDHFGFVAKNLDLFGLSGLKQIPEGYERNSASVRAFEHLVDNKGWIRLRVWSGNLLIQAKSLYEARKASDQIYSVLDHIKKIRVEAEGNNWYEADANSFKELGFGAFLKGAPVTAKASLPTRFWIAPDGKRFDAGTHHGAWIKIQGREILPKYGIHFTTLGITWTQMIEKGWVRVSNEGSGFQIQVFDLTRIPSFVDDLIAEYYDKGSIIEMGDQQGRYIKIPNPFPNIQKVVNKELRKTSSLQILAGKVTDVDGVRVYINPTQEELVNVSKAFHKESMHLPSIRALIDERTGDIYAWDAWLQNHDDMEKQLGIEKAYHWYGSWDEVTHLYATQEDMRRNEVTAGNLSTTYTDQQMEDIYQEQHEYNDSPGGGNVYHDFSNSSTDYPKEPGPYRIRLDLLNSGPDRQFQLNLPDYSVVWFSAMPNE